MNNEMKQEAIKRMKLLELDDSIVKAFANQNKIYKTESDSETIGEINEIEKSLVHKFEKENDAIIYHLIYSNNTIDMLFIDKDKKYWKNAKEDIKRNIICSFSVNIKEDFQVIGIVTTNGCIKRII